MKMILKYWIIWSIGWLGGAILVMVDSHHKLSVMVISVLAYALVLLAFMVFSD